MFRDLEVLGWVACLLRQEQLVFCFVVFLFFYLGFGGRIRQCVEELHLAHELAWTLQQVVRLRPDLQLAQRVLSPLFFLRLLGGQFLSSPLLLLALLLLFHVRHTLRPTLLGLRALRGGTKLSLRIIEQRVERALMGVSIPGLGHLLCGSVTRSAQKACTGRVA